MVLVRRGTKTQVWLFYRAHISSFMTTIQVGFLASDLNPLGSVEANRAVIRLKEHKVVRFEWWWVLQILTLTYVTIEQELSIFELENNYCVEKFVDTTRECELDAEVDEEEPIRGSMTCKDSLDE